MKKKCPKCSNWVEGKKVSTFARKMTRGAVKKGSAMATGAAIGSIIPGIGTVVGGLFGLAAGALMEDTVNDAADLVEDIAFDETEYEFKCPKCRHYWKSKKSNGSTNIPENSYSIDRKRYAILEIIKSVSSLKTLNEGCSLSFAGVDKSKLSEKIKKELGIKIYVWEISSCCNIKELIDLIEKKKEHQLSKWKTHTT